MRKYIVLAGVVVSFLFVLGVLGGAAQAGSLVVKTYPDGYRDSDIAYLYKDKISTICFYLFNSDGQPIEMKDVKFSMELPGGMEIISYGFINHGKVSKYYDMTNSKRDNSFVWQLNCEKGSVDNKFFPTGWTIYSTYHLYVYLKSAGSVSPDKFTIRWKFKDDKTILTETEGKINVELLAGPKGRKNPKNFIVWTESGIDSTVQDTTVFNNWLDIAGECGVTGIIQAGLPGKPSEALRDLETIKNRGFALVDRTILEKFLAFGPAVSKYPAADKYYHLDLGNTRPRRNNEKLAGNALLWCPSVFIEDGSPLLNMLTEQLERTYQQGFRYFFVDSEYDIYSCCFCDYCKKDFAKYINANQGEILKIAPLDLIDKYPLEWYKFRSWQIGNLFRGIKQAAEKNCPELKVGLNAQLTLPGAYTKGLGYGWAWFCEDPRFTDFGVDFHNPDNIKGGMEDIIRLDLWCRPQDSYGIEIKKPVIPRVGFFCDISWNYFCVVGRKAYAYEQGKKFGTDKRGELLKLGIANDAALGAKGVEASLASDITDARIINEADKAMEFVAEFENMFFDGERLNEKRTEVYDLTAEPSPYDKIGPGGYYDALYFYGSAKPRGFIRYITHQMKGDRVVSLFNWDFYQTKNLLVKIPDMPEGNYYLHLYHDGDRYLLIRGEKKNWSEEDLRNGISLDLQGGEIAGIYISKMKREGYANARQDKAYSAGEKTPIDLYAWRGPIPSEPTTRDFDGGIYNRALNGIRKAHPEIVPEKYLKK